jgi:hypothetical protein
MNLCFEKCPVLEYMVYTNPSAAAFPSPQTHLLPSQDAVFETLPDWRLTEPGDMGTG